MGYDRHVVVKLALEDVLSLALVASLCMVSAGMYAVSTGYLAYIAVYTDEMRWVIAGGIGSGVLVFAITMQRLFVTTGGYAHHWDQERLAQWRPDRLRLLCVFLIASSLSLPFVLMRNHERLDTGVEESRQTKVAFYRDQLRQYRQAQEQALAQQRSRIAEREQGLSAPHVAGGSAPTFDGATSALNKKALLIGVQNYEHDRPAPGVTDDLRSLQQALRRAGFSTVVSLDGSADKLRLTIDSYLKSLAPGDIGVVYYGGFILAQAGRNYLTPSDYRQAPDVNRYPVAQLIDELMQAKLQAGTVILDAAAWPSGQESAVLAAVRAAPATLVALRTAPGASPPNRDMNGESLAAALVHHLGPGMNLRQALERAAQDDLERASRSKNVVRQIKLTYGKGTEPARPNVPATTTAETTQVAALTVPTMACSSALGAALQRCLRAQLHVFDARLAAFDDGRREDESAVDQYRDSVGRSSMLHERWKLLWKNPTVITQIFLVILVMMAGDLLRDLRAGPLRRYEQLRASDARDAVETAYAHVRQKVGQMLARYPAGPLPGLRWHERPRYFGQPSAALLSLGGVASMLAGSEAELRGLLGLTTDGREDTDLNSRVDNGDLKETAA
jgi:hypothetical protein